MKVVILAGGLGTRLSEETGLKPKPMVEVGGEPILRHIMSIYADWGVTDFVVALGYLGSSIKRYFHDMATISGDLDIDLRRGVIEGGSSAAPPWRVQLVETGTNAMTGGRLGRLRGQLSTRFMLTYGDGVADINIDALRAFHEAHGRTATITAVRPPARFGALTLSGDQVSAFAEKSHVDEGWINGGFMVLEPAIFDHIVDDNTSLEADVLTALAKAQQLCAYRHPGFWQCMDTLRDVRTLNDLCRTGAPPWRR